VIPVPHRGTLKESVAEVISSIVVCAFLAGCGGKDVSARLDAVEAQNKALAAQVRNLAKESGDNRAMLAKAGGSYETLDEQLKELAARMGAVTLAQGKETSKLGEIVNSNAETFQKLFRYTEQRFYDESTARGLERMKAYDDREQESHAICDFFNPDLLTLHTFYGFVFYVLPTEVVPHAGGTTLKFRIGNPYSAQFTNVAIAVTHGSVKPKHTIDDAMNRGMRLLDKRDAASVEAGWREYKEAERADTAADSKWRNSLKTYNISRDKLAAGGWTDCEVLIPDADLTNLRYLDITISPGGVSLAKEQR